jgi:hypothetical protein
MQERATDRESGRFTRAVRRRLTYANVMATVAVFLAVGGGGFAVASHLTVRASDIVNNAVRSRHLENGDVKIEDLAPGLTTRVIGRFNDGPVPSTDTATNLISVNLPAGKYLILGKLTAVYDQVEYECRLVAGADFDRAKPLIVDPDTSFGRETLTMTVLHTSNTSFTAGIQCPDNQPGKSYNQRDLKLTAVKVAALSNAPG